MARVILLAGGNLGDVKRTLQCAQQSVNSRIGAVLRCSHRYESEPWGFRADGRFFNQALEVSTDLRPEEVLDAVQQIERELGRNRAAETLEKASSGARYVSRPIDIDIIFYDDLVINSERLTVPHPRLAEREFALVPLCEIVRGRRHPVSGLTVGEMLDALRANQIPDSCEK
ncbi:MAG: 2-amino-4-hydroxy-6-hydroxymethyldihydropteridine diphosphokinase [Alistipes sp.]|nr:2-amino-4-hydroxy-6-hydroxymethyldihydropteridine diphosphokinase [Alistipes sp.]